MLKKLSRRTLVTLTIIANIIYIIWRIFFTVPEGQGIISLIFAIALLIVEVMGMCEMFIHFYGMANIQIPTLPEIDEDLFPDVDIFIATYNEPVELVQKTINGCLRMDYPDFSKVHIYVCDDGCRAAMEAITRKMGVGYIIRDEHKHAKAGNLNHAMTLTNSPIIVTFDADMIPRHEFLMKTVPFFLQNEQAKKDGRDEQFQKIGFIQTPQCFYNTDLFQFNLHSENRIPNEQDYFYRDVQTAKNATNSVIYGGSNTVISREALNEVGGFYVNSITEDFATGILIQNKGYRCYALNTALASGLSPGDLRSLIKQRERWGRGCIQTGRRVKILFLKGLSIGQKLSYLSSITYWYASIKRFLYIMAPIVFSVFGIIVVDCTLPEVLLFWLPMFVLTNATIKKFSNNIRNTRWTDIYETIMFQALMLPIILESFGITQRKFLVTRKDGQGQSERNYQIRNALPFAIYVVLSIIGICNMIHATFVTESAAYAVVIFWLASNLYHLGMAVFFLLGRRQFRNSDRFNAEIEYHLVQGTLDMRYKTIDISEDGFALYSERPEYIDPDKEFDITFFMDTEKNKYSATMKGKIVQVAPYENGWKYAGIISEIDEENRDEWNAIVHDRLPSLPQTIIDSKGFYDDFEINIRRRLQKRQYFTRKTARIQIAYSYKINGIVDVWVKDFNYHYMMLEVKGRYKDNKVLNIPIARGAVLRCVKSEKQFENVETLYEITNINEIMEDVELRNTITNEMIKAHAASLAHIKKVKMEDHHADELNLTDFV